MRRLLLPLLLLSACKFDTSTSAGPALLDADLNRADADPLAPDADPLAPDADPAAPDAQPIAFCGWEYDPVYFDPCGDPPTTNPLMPLNLNIATNPPDSPYTYDTDGNTLTDPLGQIVEHLGSDVGSNRVLWTSSFSIATGTRLRVVGARPLVIASKSSIVIDGALSVSSFFTGSGMANPGAGSQPPAACMQDEAGRGEDCEHGGGGGGGGGFSGNGGTGGVGGDEHPDCDGADEFGDDLLGGTGGEGGGLAAAPTTLRGGCAGLEGGNGQGASGIGAPGGGAVHLTAVTTLSVTGRIHAGGAGGRGGPGSRGAGGGGGSGGMIGLEAATIDLSTTAATISANGGGGGGGGNGAGDDGDDAKIDGTQAIGGLAADGDGTPGGDGGWVDGANGGSIAVTAKRGGGGGGGGAGYILTYQSTPTLGATISPAAIAGP